MKKYTKTLVALLALAAAATPAFALEHEVSGRFASFFAVSNYSATGALQDSAPTSNWFDQRLRLAYQAKADENVKLVSKFELDYAFWGNNSYVAARNSGGGIGADSVNIETKNLYLDWTAPSLNLNTKIGMQGYDDAFSGIIFSTDMAGILMSHSYTNATASVGFFRWNDDAGTGAGGGDTPTGVVGRKTQDLFVLDGKFNLSDSTKVGAAYYYIQDKTDGFDSKVHTVGVNAEAALDGINLKAFVLGQFGDLDDASNTDAKGYAAKLAAKAAVGNGALRADLLYVAGGSNQLYVTRDGNGYYDNEMMIISRDKNATTIDNALVYDLNNNGEGVMFAALGFDQPLSPTLTASANVGFAMVADNNGDAINAALAGAGLSPMVDSDEDYIGTEVNLELVKKATENVSVSARAGYVFLGDHYLGNPDNPYAVNLMVAYAF